MTAKQLAAATDLFLVSLLNCVSCSKVFLRSGNNPVVLKNSIEQTEPLFIALVVCHVIETGL